MFEGEEKLGGLWFNGKNKTSSAAEEHMVKGCVVIGSTCMKGKQSREALVMVSLRCCLLNC